VTSEQRKSPNNGIWLCGTCATLIDASPDAWTVEGLHRWKQHAEERAARDARATLDEVSELVERIDRAMGVLLGFAAQWEINDPSHQRPYHYGQTEEHVHVSWEGWTNALSRYSTLRRIAYASEVAPLVAEVMHRCELILGPDNRLLVEARRDQLGADTNYISMRMFVDRLVELRTALKLR
jgi:hypothetical protein